jgi:hypothetical protein
MSVALPGRSSMAPQLMRLKLSTSALIVNVLIDCGFDVKEC